MSLNDFLMAGFDALGEYLSEHVLWCLVPAFFIAGAVAAFVKKEAVLKYFGRDTPKRVSYPVASVSGGILAVCSCTILPLFASIRKRGAGLGPAVSFLFAGPAINILAIVYTARVLGYDLGLARAVAAILMALVAGVLMALIFKEKFELPREKAITPGLERNGGKNFNGDSTGSSVGKLSVPVTYMVDEGPQKNVILGFFFLLITILILGGTAISLMFKVGILSVLTLVLAIYCYHFFEGEDIREWFRETYDLFKMIFPLLIIGVFIVGIIGEILTEDVVKDLVGGNSLRSIFIASIIGALMYFATLTEVPIIETLMDLGMGKGPALALLLAGPALSLPNMIIIKRILGTKKTLVYITIVVILATISGMIFALIID